jgi:[acyl-carrier-protein] S-malonyltransferase
MKVTVVFPGQGTQYVGMGTIFSGHAHFASANSATGYNLEKLMLEGPAEDLKLTENTQPAIVTHSLIMFEKLKSILDHKNIKIERLLGHSVGEYAALAAAGVIEFSDAVKAVHYRGKYMQESVPQGKGTMYAILKQSEATIIEACEAASNSEESVSPANFNEPNQIVISGDKVACETAIRLMGEKTNDRVKAIELQVSAPFHCALMKPAEIKLKSVLDKINFNPLKFPYIANVDAHEYGTDTNPALIKENLLKQVCGSVLWTQSIQKLSDETIIIECGPGKVLAGLIKKINPNLKVISLDNETGFSEVEAL